MEASLLILFFSVKMTAPSRLTSIGISGYDKDNLRSKEKQELASIIEALDKNSIILTYPTQIRKGWRKYWKGKKLTTFRLGRQQNDDDHTVRKSSKMSQPKEQCLEITQNFAFEFSNLGISHQFVQLKLTCLVTLLDCKL